MAGDEIKLYQRISNLPILSKLLKSMVALQLRAYVRHHQLLPPLQSGFRSGRSAGTAVLHVVTDVLQG
jgi:hypothetical protein